MYPVKATNFQCIFSSLALTAVIAMLFSPIPKSNVGASTFNRHVNSDWSQVLTAYSGRRGRNPGMTAERRTSCVSSVGGVCRG